MRGGSLTRYRPDDGPGGTQYGGASIGTKKFLKDVAKLALSGAASGFKKGTGVKGRIRSAKAGAKRAVKRKVEEAAVRTVKRKLNDIFGE